MSPINPWKAYEAARKKAAEAKAFAQKKAREAAKAATETAQAAAVEAEKQAKTALDALNTEIENIKDSAAAFVDDAEKTALFKVEELRNSINLAKHSDTVKKATKQAMDDYRHDFELLKTACHQLPKENIKAMSLDYESLESEEFSISPSFEDLICPYLRGLDGMADDWKQGSVVVGLEGSVAAIAGVVSTPTVGGIPGLFAISPYRISHSEAGNKCRVYKEHILVGETNATVSAGITIGFSKNAPKDLHGPFFTGFAGVGDGIGVGASAFFSVPKDGDTDVSLIGIAFNAGLEVSLLPAQVGIGVGWTRRLPAYMAIRYLATGEAW